MGPNTFNTEKQLIQQKKGKIKYDSLSKEIKFIKVKNKISLEMMNSNVKHMSNMKAYYGIYVIVYNIYNINNNIKLQSINSLSACLGRYKNFVRQLYSLPLIFTTSINVSGNE